MRAVATKIAWLFLGLPYRWGGDDPMQGFDCSGFVIELLKSVGLLPVGFDTTANGLWKMYADREIFEPYEGCLVFYGTGGYVSHVEYCLSPELSIGASGGRSSTTDLDAAVRQNAYIKVRPLGRRDDVRGFADPFKEKVPVPA